MGEFCHGRDANVPPIPLKYKGFNLAAHKHVIPLVGLVTVTG